MADCERGLGRPDRALTLAGSPEAATLDALGSVELRMVVAGARLDLGEPDAAVLALEGPALRSAVGKPWGARLLSAYADALAAAGRGAEALLWMRKAADADASGATGAAARLLGSDADGDADGVVIDLLIDSDDGDVASRGDEPGLVAPVV